MKETYGFDPFSRILTQYKITDDGRKILTLYETSDDDKVQESVEFIDKKEYDDLTKQLEYANKKIENRDVMIEEIRRDREYWRQQVEVYIKLHGEDQKHDKTEALKGTIRGLEKTRDKLKTEINKLTKKLTKAENRLRGAKEHITDLKAGEEYWYQECMEERRKNK